MTAAALLFDRHGGFGAGQLADDFLDMGVPAPSLSRAKSNSRFE